jgi:hypothetical protein
MISAKIKAESEAEIAAISTRKQVAAKEAQKQMEEIDNEIHTSR